MVRLHADAWGRSLYQKAKSALAGGMRQRITLAGAGFSATVAVVGMLAFLTANNLLFLILACLSAALLISGFLNRLSLAGLAVDIVFPEHVSARRNTPARLRIQNEKTWMPSFSIHVEGTPESVFASGLYFPILPAGSVLEEPVEVYFARRGQHSQDSFRIRSRFPFGFAERRILVTLRREALVYPSLEPSPWLAPLFADLQGEIQAASRGRGYDFYRIRPYEHLESARYVDWKATAHTGELQVREFAKEQEPLVEICLDLAGWENRRESFERAVDCCAFLAWEIAAKGSRVRFRCADFDVTTPAEGSVYIILRYLALVEPRKAGAASGPGREDSIQVLVSAAPQRLLEAGWHRARVVGPDELDGATAGEPAQAGSRS